MNEVPSSMVVGEDTSVRQALRLIEDNYEKTLICVDDSGAFVGVVVDGDVRRGLLKGYTLDDSVMKVVNRKALSVNEFMDFVRIEELLKNVRYKVIPVVDSRKRIKGYYSKKRLLSQKFDIRERRVTIVGMGYVGMTLGCVLAESGFVVKGFDVHRGLIDTINNKKMPFYEYGLQNYLDDYVGRNLRVTDSIESAVGDVYIITVGTPFDKKTMRPEIGHIIRAVRMLCGVIKKDDVVVLRSTVPVGCSRNTVIRMIQEERGLTCGKDYSLAFAPERTAEGVALQELKKNPQIIGAFDRRSFEISAQIFNTFTRTIIEVTSLEAAELCKLIDNTFRDHLFSFSNMLVPLTEKLGLDIREIIDAVNFGYPRNRIASPSPGVGGPCLVKDPYLLKSVFDGVGIDAPLIRAVREINESGHTFLCDKLVAQLRKLNKDLAGSRIALVGIAFKGEPETSDFRDSTSLWFLELLKGKTDVVVYDPVIEPEKLQVLGVPVVDVEAAFLQTDAVVILNNHRSYNNWDIHSLTSRMNKPAVIIDSWNIFGVTTFREVKGVVYVGYGR